MPGNFVVRNFCGFRDCLRHRENLSCENFGLLCGQGH